MKKFIHETRITHENLQYLIHKNIPFLQTNSLYLPSHVTSKIIRKTYASKVIFSCKYSIIYSNLHFTTPKTHLYQHKFQRALTIRLPTFSSTAKTMLSQHSTSFNDYKYTFNSPMKLSNKHFFKTNFLRGF